MEVRHGSRVGSGPMGDKREGKESEIASAREGEIHGPQSGKRHWDFSDFLPRGSEDSEWSLREVVGRASMGVMPREHRAIGGDTQFRQVIECPEGRRGQAEARGSVTRDRARYALGDGLDGAPGFFGEGTWALRVDERVNMRMAANLMTHVRDCPEDIRVAFGHPTQAEEGGTQAANCKKLEQPIRVLGESRFKEIPMRSLRDGVAIKQVKPILQVYREDWTRRGRCFD